MFLLGKRRRCEKNEGDLFEEGQWGKKKKKIWRKENTTEKIGSGLRKY